MAQKADHERPTGTPSPSVCTAMASTRIVCSAPFPSGVRRCPASSPSATGAAPMTTSPTPPWIATSSPPGPGHAPGQAPGRTGVHLPGATTLRRGCLPGTGCGCRTLLQIDDGHLSDKGSLFIVALPAAQSATDGGHCPALGAPTARQLPGSMKKGRPHRGRPFFYCRGRIRSPAPD